MVAQMSTWGPSVLQLEVEKLAAMAEVAINDLGTPRARGARGHGGHVLRRAHARDHVRNEERSRWEGLTRAPGRFSFLHFVLSSVSSIFSLLSYSTSARTLSSLLAANLVSRYASSRHPKIPY